jgi:hypothetical protein
MFNKIHGMKVEKILKRFMKESGIYNMALFRDTSLFMNAFDEAFVPFNSFRWDTTKQGYNFWYDKSLHWLAYLYYNVENIDNNEILRFNLTNKAFYNAIGDLLDCYKSDYELDENLDGIEAVKALKKILTASQNVTDGVDIYQK